MMKRFFLATACVIVATLMVFALLRIYRVHILHANEALLEEDLCAMRHAIRQYTHDKGKAPQTLHDLVTAGYLRAIPKDPFTHSEDTWQPQPVQDDILTNRMNENARGITDVKRGASLNSADGTAYSSW
jgi:general secretion pathway protein G